MKKQEKCLKEGKKRKIHDNTSNKDVLRLSRSCLNEQLFFFEGILNKAK